MPRVNTKLIVALDSSERYKIVDTAVRLGNKVDMVKIGLQAFTACGPDLIKELRDHYVHVFLDLKLNDIPNTVKLAAEAAASQGVEMMTIHAGAGQEAIQAALVGAHPYADVVAVTSLTSLNDHNTRSMYNMDVTTLADSLATLAINHGADGIVCSGHELERFSHLRGYRVVPGVRMDLNLSQDQKRVMTPREAIEKGATWLVVGRDITQSPDPVGAAENIVNTYWDLLK